MATFHIHEDKENYQKHVVQRPKNYHNDGQEKKILTKKNSFGNRVILQPLNNGIRQDSKRVKLTVKNNETVKEITLKNDKVIEDLKGDSIIEDSFFKIEKENNGKPKKKNTENDAFPVCLLHNEEYRKDIWQYLRDSESTGLRPRVDYMSKQVELNWNTRSILIDWLVSVSEEYKFCHETFHLSVNYIDRFLSQISVVRNKFQLVGAAAMMLASKMEEYQPIDAQEWSFLTGDTFSSRQVLKMEQLIIRVLRFRMQSPTIHTFIQHLCSEHKMDSKIVHLAMYISELVLLEGEDYLEQFPSKLAAASIALARYTCAKQKPWPEKLKKASGYTLKELSPVVQRQQKTFRDSPMKEQQAIQTKYKSDKYDRVALLKPRVLMLDDMDDEE